MNYAAIASILAVGDGVGSLFLSFFYYENKLMFSLQLYLVVVLPASLVLGLAESPSF